MKRKSKFIPPNKYKWSKEEIQFLQDHFFALTNPELADLLGLKLTSVRTKCYELGLKRMELQYWTKEQVDYLKKNYLKKGDTEIAEYFAKKFPKNKPWTIKHIEKKRRYLGLKRPAEIITAIKTRNIKKGRFALCPVKAWASRGVSPLGAIRKWKNQYLRECLYIKTKKGYVPYAPWLYKKTFGKVPAGMMVTFKDGNQLNVVPENLKLITMEENARRNSQNRLPPELQQTKKLLIQLNKKLKKNEQQTN